VLDVDGRVVGTVSRIVDGTDNALVDYPDDWGDGYPIDRDGTAGWTSCWSTGPPVDRASGTRRRGGASSW
jgi:hypothetical protein